MGVRSDFIEYGVSNPRRGEKRGNGLVIVQNADDNDRAGLGVFFALHERLSKHGFTLGFLLCS